MDLDAGPVEQRTDAAVDDHQLHLCRGAEVVEQHGDLVATLEGQISKEKARHFLGKCVRRHELAALDARLAMGAHADFDLVIAEFEGELAGFRQ